MRFLRRMTSPRDWLRAMRIPLACLRSAFAIRSDYDVVRFLLGLVVLTAALAKCHELCTEPTFGTTLLTSRVFLSSFVCVEFAFGCWLVSGLAPSVTRVTASLWFAVLAAVSLSSMLAAESTCAGCFGRLARIPAWAMFVFDVAAVSALWLAQAEASRRRSSGAASRFSIFAIVAIGTVSGAATAMATHSPPSQRVFVLPPHIYDGETLAPAFYELPVVNDTQEPVRLLDVRTSCGCTKHELRDNTLAPGQSTTVALQIDARGIIGTRTVFVALTDTTENVWAEYTVKLAAFPRIAFESPDIYIAPLRPHCKVSRTVTVDTYALTGDEPPSVSIASSDPVNVRAKAGPSIVPSTSHGVLKRSTKVQLDLLAPAVTAHQVTRIAAKCSDRETGNIHTALLRVHWAVESVCRLAPARIFVDCCGKDGRVQRTVTIQRDDGRQFNLTRVECRHVAIRCAPSPSGRAPQKAWTVSVEIDPSQISEPIWSTIEVETADADAPLLSLPIAVLP
jgi:hypothetical protein